MNYATVTPRSRTIPIHQLSLSNLTNCANNETRTHTPLRTPPPQGGLSTSFSTFANKPPIGIKPISLGKIQGSDIELKR